jgi:hypothetical protein
MKTALIRVSLTTLAASTLALAACASGPNVAPPPAGFDAADTQFTGWVRVRGEEFKLYAEERDLRAGGATPCVSGALPRNAQRAAGDLDGSQVRFSGRTTAWADRSGGQSHDWQGSNITNQCRRDVVILADRAEVIR